MKKILRFFHSYLTTIYQNIVTVTTVAFFSKRPTDLRQLRPRASRECVLMGNGPSLRQSVAAHPDLLKGREIICTNFFLDTGLFFNLRPRYYVFLDPMVWSREASNRFKEKFKLYNQQLRDDVSWPLYIFLPVAAQSWNYLLDLPRQNSNIRIIYVNTTQVQGSKILQHWLFRNNLAMPTMHTVLVGGIFIALNMGFRLSYILGGESSWHKNIHVGNDNHLYVTYERVDQSEAPKPALFFEDQGETRPYTMRSFLSWLEKVFRGYYELAIYAKSLDARVINATPDSFIDTFERWQD